MGAVNSTGSKLEKALAADLPESERYFGLDNLGNTCFANSVLQAVYFCEPFRRAVLEYDRARKAAKNDGGGRPLIRAYSPDSLVGAASGAAADAPGPSSSTGEESNMLTALADLFSQISSQKKRTGSVPPKSFINKLRQVNDQFSSYMHQDAHEFLLFLLNDIVECLNREYTDRLRDKRLPAEEEPPKTFVHSLFEGQTTSETRCLCCETEAELRKRIKRLPQILALHLKRFKYIEQYGKAKKLSYRVVFPLELRLYNTSDDAEDPDRLYALFAVVVHVGSGPSQGHYVALIKSFGQWLLFDDDCVEPKDESELQAVFGITQDSSSSTEAGFILFYEAVSTGRIQ